MGVSVTLPNSAAPLRDGQLVGRWTVGEKLGAGGTATVYRANGPAGPVALRICRPVSNAHRDAIIGTYRRLPSHPNVTRPIDVFTTILGGAEHVVVVTDLADGPTLAESIATGPLPSDDIGPLVNDLMAGLDAFHRRGLVHGDLKPSNVMLFGTRWRLVDPSATAPSERRGNDVPTTSVVSHERTVRYLPPEVIDTPGTSRRAVDVWALGVTLFEACTGRSPFASMSAQLAVEYTIPSTVDRRARKVIDAALTVSDDRPRTAGELADALTEPARQPRGATSRRWWFGGAAAVTVAAAAFMVLDYEGDAGVDTPTGEANATVGADEVTASTPTSDSPTVPLVVTPPVDDQTAAAADTEPADDVALSTGRVDLEFDTSDDTQRLVATFDEPADMETTIDQGRSVLRVGANNVNRSMLIEGLTGRSTAMEAEVALAAYNSPEFGVEGSVHGLVLKAFIDEDGSYGNTGGYIVALSAQPEGVGVWVGAARSLSATGIDYTLFGPADGHAVAEHQVLFPLDYTLDPETRNELGFWRLRAQLEPYRQNPNQAVVDVWVTSPDGTTEQLRWVDDGPAANSHVGAVGLVNYGVWSIPNRWDRVAAETYDR